MADYRIVKRYRVIYEVNDFAGRKVAAFTSRKSATAWLRGYDMAVKIGAEMAGADAPPLVKRRRKST